MRISLPVFICLSVVLCFTDVLEATLVETVDYIAWEDVPNMVHEDFVTSGYYDFEFVYGSKDISDGSDFEAVRRAFGTWVDLPDSDISFSEESSAGQLSLGSTNGRNEISWISADCGNGDPWIDQLGFSERAIAVAVTWYNPDTFGVIEQDIYFNDIYMDWYTDTDGEFGFYVENIALHEIGHIFGLRDVYNPGADDYEDWMGRSNQFLTMYGYGCPGDEDITLTEYDIYAMALAHPVPEPRALLLFALTLAGVTTIKNRTT